MPGRVVLLGESSEGGCEPIANGLPFPAPVPRRSAPVFHSAPLTNQHTVAVAVETVAFLDGMTIGAENLFPPRKRADQRQQA